MHPWSCIYDACVHDACIHDTCILGLVVNNGQQSAVHLWWRFYTTKLHILSLIVQLNHILWVQFFSSEMSHLIRLISGSSEVLNLYLNIFWQILSCHFINRYFILQYPNDDEGFPQRQRRVRVKILLRLLCRECPLPSPPVPHGMPNSQETNSSTSTIYLNKKPIMNVKIPINHV